MIEILVNELPKNKTNCPLRMTRFRDEYKKQTDGLYYDEVFTTNILLDVIAQAVVAIADKIVGDEENESE